MYFSITLVNCFPESRAKREGDMGQVKFDRKSIIKGLGRGRGLDGGLVIRGCHWKRTPNILLTIIFEGFPMAQW